MIFLPDRIFEAREKLLDQLGEDEPPTAELCNQLLELDPADHIALMWLARLCQEEEDRAGAEAYYWRSIQAQPCAGTSYLELSELLSEPAETVALADGLAELGLAKFHPDETDEEPVAPQEDEERWAMVLEIREKRSTEPAEVTKKLRLLRMVQEILEVENLATEKVDEILAEGSAMVPLLSGILSAWANELLHPDADGAMENALALMGELGTAAEIPDLLEFVDLEHEIAAGASRWAVTRIIARHTSDAHQLFLQRMPEMGLAGRLTAVDQILQNRALDPDGVLLELATRNLQTMKSPERDRYFPMLLGGLAAIQGKPGVELGKAAFLRERGRLSTKGRKEAEAMLAGLAGEDVAPIEPEPLKWTVHDICLGDAIWSEEDEASTDEDEELPAEPIRKADVPGRNDPCWCNSGKKYKKCHMEADQNGTPVLPDGV